MVFKDKNNGSFFAYNSDIIKRGTDKVSISHQHGLQHF